MAKKRVARHQFVDCPFCGYSVETSNPGQWCASCFIEWYISKNGGFVIFDDTRKTPRFVWAKALARAGGVRFGNPQIPPTPAAPDSPSAVDSADDSEQSVSG